MKTVLSLWKGHIPTPRVALMQIIEEEAARENVTATEIINNHYTHPVYRARKRAVNRALTELKLHVTDLAKLWGCHRRTLQRWIDREAA